MNLMFNELNRDQNQMISLTAVNAAINSASTVDSTIEVYFFKAYETVSLFIKTT